MSDNFSSTSPRGTLDARIASINSSLSFNIDDIDVDELLGMSDSEVEQQATQFAQTLAANPYTRMEDRHHVVPVATVTGPSQSGLSALSDAVSALASRGGGGDTALQLYDARDQGSLNPDVYTAWRSGEPIDRDLHTPEPMNLAHTAGDSYMPTPPECLTPPPELEEVGSGVTRQGPYEKDESTALGRRRSRLVIRESVLAKAFKPKFSSEAVIDDEGGRSEDTPTKKGKSNGVDVVEVQKKKVIRQRQARKRKTRLAIKGRLMEASKKLRKEMGMINLIQGEVECPGCGTSVVLKASLDKVNAEEEKEEDLAVE